ncbi:MAG: hypothetical protein ABIG95_03090 [Candidatus Woesearchaeota archaeon]
MDKPLPNRKEEFLADKQSFAEYLKQQKVEPEYTEVQLDMWDYEPYPTPLSKFRWVMVAHDESLEAMYYWIITSYRRDYGFPTFYKITDIFAASELSAMFGVSQQRLGLWQDKVSQFLAAAGKMVKELFQFVRELRIIDERLSLYKDSYIPQKHKADSADIALKGIWIDLVEGGGKNPASVYGLAREVGFTILPDLFFRVRPLHSKKIKSNLSEVTADDVKTLCDAEIDALDKTVDNLPYNKKMLEVLKRKLRTYLEWKKHTFMELLTRRRFTLQYFRQHYDIIRLYMSWIKPYLRLIRRVQAPESMQDSATLIGAFEGSMIEIEVLARQKKPTYGPYNAIGLLHFEYTTTPTMSYQQEGFQRGPKHEGKAVITVRSYVWDDKQIQAYLDMKKKEDIELLSTIDESLKEAMNSLGDDIKTYLVEAGDIVYKKELAEKEGRKTKEGEEKRKREGNPGAFSPLFSVFDGFKDIFQAFAGTPGEKPKVEFSYEEKKAAKSRAERHANDACWRAFKNYRKGHKMLTW